PLYLNALSSRVFEPDKITVVRVIALLVVLAWAVRQLETIQRSPGAGAGGRGADSAPAAALPAGGIWLVKPIALLVLAFVIATAASVAPYFSIWGSYQRLQGTVSLLAYVAIGLAVAANLRTRAQLDRLFTTAVLTSLPVSAYGVLQHL